MQIIFAVKTIQHWWQDFLRRRRPRRPRASRWNLVLPKAGWGPASRTSVALGEDDEELRAAAAAFGGLGSGLPESLRTRIPAMRRHSVGAPLLLRASDRKEAVRLSVAVPSRQRGSMAVISSSAFNASMLEDQPLLLQPRRNSNGPPPISPGSDLLQQRYSSSSAASSVRLRSSNGDNNADHLIYSWQVDQQQQPQQLPSGQSQQNLDQQAGQAGPEQQTHTANSEEGQERSESSDRFRLDGADEHRDRYASWQQLVQTQQSPTEDQQGLPSLHNPSIPAPDDDLVKALQMWRSDQGRMPDDRFQRAPRLSSGTQTSLASHTTTSSHAEMRSAWRRTALAEADSMLSDAIIRLHEHDGEEPPKQRRTRARTVSGVSHVMRQKRRNLRSLAAWPQPGDTVLAQTSDLDPFSENSSQATSSRPSSVGRGSRLSTMSTVSLGLVPRPLDAAYEVGRQDEVTSNGLASSVLSQRTGDMALPAAANASPERRRDKTWTSEEQELATVNSPGRDSERTVARQRADAPMPFLSEGLRRQATSSSTPNLARLAMQHRQLLSSYDSLPGLPKDHMSNGSGSSESGGSGSSRGSSARVSQASIEGLEHRPSFSSLSTSSSARGSSVFSASSGFVEDRLLSLGVTPADSRSSTRATEELPGISGVATTRLVPSGSSGLRFSTTAAADGGSTEQTLLALASFSGGGGDRPGPGGEAPPAQHEYHQSPTDSLRPGMRELAGTSRGHIRSHSSHLELQPDNWAAQDLLNMGATSTNRYQAPGVATTPGKDTVMVEMQTSRPTFSQQLSMSEYRSAEESTTQFKTVASHKQQQTQAQQLRSVLSSDIAMQLETAELLTAHAEKELQAVSRRCRMVAVVEDYLMVEKRERLDAKKRRGREVRAEAKLRAMGGGRKNTPSELIFLTCRWCLFSLGSNWPGQYVDPI